MAFGIYIWGADIKEGLGGAVNEYLLGVQWAQNMKENEDLRPSGATHNIPKATDSETGPSAWHVENMSAQWPPVPCYCDITKIFKVQLI